MKPSAAGVEEGRRACSTILRKHASMTFRAGTALRPMGTSFFGVLIACTLATQPASAEEPTAGKREAANATPNARPEDAAAIRAFMASFAKAFEARDAKALVAHWTSTGEYRNSQGVNLRGRDKLEQSFAEFFATTPEVTAQVEPSESRFLSRDSAWEEGHVIIRRGPTESATDAHYSALLVREEGQWRLAMLSESPGTEPLIADLSWLIGDWVSAAGENAELRATYEWAPNKKFIHARFTLKEQNIAFTGHQVIGVDPATGQLHSWTFEADGGIGEADWFRDGDNWVLDVTGTLADGRSLTETNILRLVSADVLTWQSVNRLLDDKDFPDLPPVKVTRVKPNK
ncbi:MAG: SgcJ/EcaC family oxidoreductase [Pirellulales bacterium]|nr:SgcJ/EcaC family oxidoreductase [Pirellulales bacterium]